MSGEIGHFLLCLSFSCSIGLALSPGLVHLTSDRQLNWATRLTWAHFMGLSGAFISLVYCFLSDDFSVQYVAQNSNAHLPLGYKLCAVWGAHEGSLLLWLCVLGFWTFLVCQTQKKQPARFKLHVLAVLGALSVGFHGFILWTSNPFLRWLPYAPLQGADLNPLLQDPGFVLHPPLLYIGYVGFSVPFAFAIAALLDPQGDKLKWMRWMKPWALVAWAALTMGITLGSWWAYYELGWGGWWFWDPVENASFMPWVLGTAFIHALYLSIKRKSFPRLTLSLAMGCFALSLMGTFLVRSGVLTSVHAFASDPGRGHYILGFLFVVIGSAFTLFVTHGAKWRFTTPQFSLFSTEAFLLLNVLLLMVCTASILLGTLYPLCLDALFGIKLSVGPPYFNLIFACLTFPLFAILPLGPALKATPQNTLRQQGMRVSFLLSLFIGVSSLMWLPSLKSGSLPLGIFLGCWVVLGSIFPLIFLSIHFKSLNWLVKTLMNKAAVIFSHIGVGVCLLGVCLNVGLDVEKDLALQLGEKVTVAQYQFEFKALNAIKGSNYHGAQGVFEVSKAGKRLYQLTPEKRRYVPRDIPLSETAIEPGFLKDIYMALAEPLDERTWSVRIHVKPFVRWIWLGGILMCFGVVIGLLKSMGAWRLRPQRDKTHLSSTKRLTYAKP